MTSGKALDSETTEGGSLSDLPIATARSSKSTDLWRRQARMKITGESAKMLSRDTVAVHFGIVFSDLDGEVLDPETNLSI